MILLDFLVQISAPMITGILGILGALLVRKLTKKWDIEKQESVVRLMDGIIVGGVAFAEEQARKALRSDGTKTDGAAKLQLAVDYIGNQLISSGILEVARDNLVDLVESKLSMERARPNGIVPCEKDRIDGGNFESMRMDS